MLKKLISCVLYPLVVLTLVIAFCGRASAAEINTGIVLTSTGTSVSATLAANQRYLFWCDASVFYAWGTSAVTVSATTGVPLAASTPWDTSAGLSEHTLAVISQTGTANCYIFQVVR